MDQLYYVVNHNEPGSLHQAWKLSVANHMCDVHVRGSKEFPVCVHGPQFSIFCEDDDTMQRRPAWLKKSGNNDHFVIQHV